VYPPRRAAQLRGAAFHAAEAQLLDASSFVKVSTSHVHL
jgi:hypothetical protein